MEGKAPSPPAQSLEAKVSLLTPRFNGRLPDMNGI